MIVMNNLSAQVDQVSFAVGARDQPAFELGDTSGDPNGCPPSGVELNGVRMLMVLALDGATYSTSSEY